MPRSLLRCLSVFLAVSLSAPPAWATCGGGGGGGRGGMSPAGQQEQVYNVPWKVLQPQESGPKEGLALYWFPLSENELKNSSLRTSRMLSVYAGQCVTMIVSDSRAPIAQKLDVRPPVAVLATPDGTAVGRAEGENGMLRSDKVEKLVNGEVSRREAGVKQKLEDGKAKAKGGDNAAAVELLKSVVAERCLFPKRAKDAVKELKKLGEKVDVEIGDFGDPVLDPARSAEIEKVMLQGLAEENAGRYEEARRLYARARKLDPADPAPVRYLAELLRHHTGQWDKARGEFERLLTMRADPLSRAVALHGLGKMTIHAGQFDNGRRLLEDSVAAYPLALAYRNLAVYWNSEGDLAKTSRYVDEALKLDPNDPFNIVFAAVFKATTGHVDEALRIAEEHEAMLPASYNLAAIHALAGHRDKALGLLRRHFHEYERYDAVRGEEMMEARVDAVFVSLRQDPEFLRLTEKADGRMQMPGQTNH